MTSLRGPLLALLLLATSLHAQTPPCEMKTATPWIQYWFDAWALTAKDILHIESGPRFDLVFYDSNCVYTTSAVSGAGAPESDGPSLLGSKFAWRAKPHGGTLTMPNGETMPVQLMSFASGDAKTGLYFVMAAPEYWAKAGITKPGTYEPAAVFLHEFAHVRQIGGFKVIGPIEDAWKFKDSFDDNVVESHFKANDEYVKAFEEERNLLFRAAAAETTDEVRKLGTEALKKIKARQARWFVGDEAVFTTLDSVWLSLEGSGQWIGYAWLKHPQGGAMSAPDAVEKMRGRRRHWSQEEGLALFLVVDRLFPDWPALVFREPSIGAVDLLDRALEPSCH